ncbi:MAG TPA: response regulator [Thermoanaerobaculia bacterium]|nr:response regulator [Thermoanaerobaculia bacterium]
MTPFAPTSRSTSPSPKSYLGFPRATLIPPRRPDLEVAATILVVDDNALNRALLEEELTHRGFEVRMAAGGEEALELIALEPFDLILLDIMMPDVDGIQVLRKVRERWSGIELPVIMTTARADRRDIVNALESGANDYVTKPIDLPVLLARVRTQLALASASKDLRTAQQRILDLSAAHRDVDSWSRATAAEISELLNADVDVVIGKRADETSIAVHETNPIGMKPSAEDGDSIHITINAAGRHSGEVIVRKPFMTREERVLVESFATQLGAALEMRDLRWELTAARQRFFEQRKEMLDRGAVLLHVCTRCGRCYEHTVPECPEDGWPLDGAQLVPLRVADRYILQRRIAVGSTARVFAAEDERLRRPVAIKIIKAEYFNDQEIRARFEHEAQAAARIDHPNVSTVFDSGSLDDGSLYFVMEQLRGLDLAQMIRLHGRGSPSQVAALLRQVGRALTAVHKAGFIHRDIKPSNIFLVEEGGGFRAKILDFGIAKSIDADTTLTRHGSFIGTPAYMAPEQIERKSRLDERTDLYAFATVAYEALAGRRVTTGKEVTKVFAEILYEMPPAISTLVNSGNLQLDTEFAKALAKDREARPASVAEWSERVAAILETMNEETAWPARFAPVD